ncbi:7333_t:CDS:2 [Ambispora gerdemannii]|uniref:7333_t:CDS:1 n=1 Tax=Ambispora gerdemannii TaxID=144530 RepID=A0A9N8VC32_9GLOM|nr:7333_t:CDS:2 [Ambispora gerdemannii]
MPIPKRTLLPNNPPRKENDKITKMIENVQKAFPDIKTTLEIRELIEPAAQTRAKGTPRPQNCFMLYRKEISAKARYTGESQSVGASSKTASETWSEVSTREKNFWQALFEIVKEQHLDSSTGMSDVESSSGSSNESSSFHSTETSIHDSFDNFSRLPHTYYALNNDNSTEINGNNFEQSYACLSSITPSHDATTSEYQYIHDSNQYTLDDYGQRQELKQKNNYHNLPEEILSNYFFEAEGKKESRLSLPMQPFPQHYLNYPVYPAQTSYFIPLEMIYNGQLSSRSDQRLFFPTSQQYDSPIAPNHKTQVTATTELSVQLPYHFSPYQMTIDEIQQRQLHDDSNTKQNNDSTNK